MTHETVVYAQGERVQLRPVALADLPHALNWLNAPETRPLLARVLPLTEFEERRYIEEQATDTSRVNFAICDRTSNEPIGFTGLHAINWISRRATFGIVLGRADLRGQGRGQEVTKLMLDVAFRTLNLHRVSLTVYATNLRAIACYEKVGYTREGTRRESHFVDGRYVDEWTYGILAREWLEKKGP